MSCSNPIYIKLKAFRGVPKGTVILLSDAAIVKLEEDWKITFFSKPGGGYLHVKSMSKATRLEIKRAKLNGWVLL